MEPSTFLAHVLPSTGHWFTTFVFPDGKVWQKSVPAGNNDELLSLTQWGMGRSADVYFGVAAYSEDTDGVVYRRAHLAKLHRCLRVDVDCGAGKSYATQRDGLTALLAGNDTIGLPRPTIVNSGYGVHVYWPFDADLPITQWLRLSSRLAGAFAKVGVHLDTTVTQDAARILRLPGTLNHKHGTTAPVRVLVQGVPSSPVVLARALAPYPDAAHQPSMTRAPGLSDNNALLAGTEHPPYSLRGVLMDCPGFNTMLGTHGAGVPEPLWKAALDVVAASSETPIGKERVALALSSGHHAFEMEEFGRKWTQTLDQGYQPATCAKFKQLGMAQCHTCPHAGRVASPVQLGRPTAAVAQPVAPVPVPVPLSTSGAVKHGALIVTPGESRVSVTDGKLGSLEIRGGIPHVVKKDGENADGKPIWKLLPIGGFPITHIELLADRMGRGSYALVTFDRFEDGPITVELGAAEQTDTKACARALAVANIRMRSEHVNIFRDIVMTDFLAQLQKLRRSGQIASRCGWTDSHEEFVLGTTIYAAGKAPESIRASGTVDAIEPYHVKGDYASWLQGFNVALSGGGERQALLALALGAPLLAFTGVDGVMLNAFSPESGVGKTTLCEAASSIWGDPTALRRDAKDTHNSIFRLAAATGNLPFIIDEFTNVEGKQLSDFVYTLTQGRERHRMTSDAKLQANTNRWCLPLIATSNNSVHDKLLQYRPDADAEAARVFEMRLSPMRVDPAALSLAKVTLNQLRHNYGFIGPKVVELLMSRPSDKWRLAVQNRIAGWDLRMAAGSADRFRSALCAVAELGAELGKILGLAFDVKVVRDTLESQWTAQADMAKEQRVAPDQLVAHYLMQHLRDLTIFGGDTGNAMVYAGGGTQFYGEIRGTSHHGKFTAERVMIPMSRLKEHAKEHNFNWTAAYEAITKGVLQPHVNKLTNLTFMAGQPNSMRSRGVEFTAYVLGQVGAVKLPAPDTGVQRLSTQ